MTVDGGVSISTTGQPSSSGANPSYGIIASSLGGNGNTSGELNVDEGGGVGDGGYGGSGYAVTVNVASGASITTTGASAAAIVARSVGGGGGTGGSAYSTSASLGFSASVAVGGYCPDSSNCPSGGAGGTVTASVSNTTISTGQGMSSGTTNQQPVDAFGIVAQSVGGGGGAGGSASAQAIAIGIPNPVDGAQISASVSGSAGGTGGSGGNGGSVTVALPTGTTITTQGQGSHGILAQSVGGGGGTAGDSSSFATTVSYGRAATAASSQAFTLDVGYALGGQGGVAGIGFPVTVEIGGQSGASVGSAAITTFGDYANGVLAHSVGGGGGNAGYGSSTTEAFGGTGTLTFIAGLGGAGGSGQTGGDVTATLHSGDTITTHGASALGIAAQSIGGGGGASQGGTINLGGSEAFGTGETVTPGFNGTVNWGGVGSGGGNGAQVTVNVDGTIRTFGGDSTGVLAHSVGGGGGLGGSAGAEASADNPISALTFQREIISAAVESNLPFSAGFNVTLGGTGGAAGTGGTVVVNHNGTIVTQGDWAQGIVAQSVGGGGGKGGTAVSSGINAVASLGVSIGGGGAGGDGGTVTVNLGSGSIISTGLASSAGNTGYGAFGILAQSVGGGGGMGADGSAAATGRMSIGGGWPGGGGSTGSGQVVTLTGSASITTVGDLAHGVVLQSIGGGGGVGGSGSSLTDNFGQISGQINLDVTGTAGSSGDGRAVTVSDAVLVISTSGANAYGLLAQSVGGGGGLGFTSPNVTTNVTLGGAGNGNGGDVGVTLLAGSAISTTGVGAHGLIAQSVGGGGGIGGSVSGTPTLSTVLPGSSSYIPANGGNVTVNLSGSIATTGAGAHGIIAQSVGNGGGLLANGGSLYAGSLYAASSLLLTSGKQVSVTVNAGAQVSASGTNAVGIFAQTASSSSSYGSRVTVNGVVQGGQGPDGAGVWIADGFEDGLNMVTIGAGGSLSALSGQAVVYTGGWSLMVDNYGTLTGSVSAGLGGGVNNYGTWNSSGTSTANVVNTGLLVVGAPGSFAGSAIIGNLTQGADGTFAGSADFAGRRAAVLSVQGDAILAGQMRPLITTVLPNIALPVLTVTGDISGGLSGAPSTLFGYGVTRAGNTFSVAATSADFTPPRFQLADSHVAVASHMQGAWEAGGNNALAPLFALLGNTADLRGASGYAAQLRQLSPDSTFAPGARGAEGARNFANTTLSCPQFEGTTAMLVERQCTWLRVTGRTAGQDSGNGVSSFRLNTATWQIGGQKDLGSGWLLGGSLAYEMSNLSSTDKLNSGNGQAGYGALTLKYQTGPWLFAASAFGGAGQFNTSRVITLPGFASVAKGNPDTSNIGLLLRASYTIGGESFYARPSLSLATVRVGTGAYREAGGGVLNLAVDSASQTTAMLTPMLEIGGRVPLGDDMLLRPFVVAGISVLSSDKWQQTGRLISAPAGSGSFTTAVPMDQVVGRLTVGAQLYTSQMLDFRLQYDGEYGGSLTAHGGSLTMALRF